MKVAFFQGGSRWKFDSDGKQYTDANLNESIWKRYLEHSDSLCVVLRKDQQIYSEKEAHSSFNIFNTEEIESVILPDLYRPKKKFFSLSQRRKTKQAIRKVIQSSDFSIIREVGNFYTDFAAKYAKKTNKPYLIEVTSDIHEVLRNHGMFGKILSFLETRKCKKIIQDAPFVIYVTNSYLQHSYPSNGQTLGCSDVDIDLMEKNEAEKKISNFPNSEVDFHIGTAAYLDVEAKGQKDVIDAIALLSKQGVKNIKYHLLGSGSGQSLIAQAQNLGVSSSLQIDGAVPHDEVVPWIDSLDLYIHPSHAEGLSRSIIEAMSRACPTICSDVGGNYELVPDSYRFTCADSEDIAKKIQQMQDAKMRQQCAKEEYERACNFSSEALDKKRAAFLSEFFAQ